MMAGERALSGTFFRALPLGHSLDVAAQHHFKAKREIS
jgi:hypothetical protein